MRMLRKLNDIKDCVLRGRDGEIGCVNAFLFDDVTWTVRYIVSTMGEWLSHAIVLISPISVRAIDENRHMVSLSLDRDQVMNGPRFDRTRPLTRRDESEYYRHYGWPVYWNGPERWGMSAYPTDIYVPNSVGRTVAAAPPATLRSTSGVAGFDVRAKDGLLGYVDDHIVDDDTWAIGYVIVNTRQWLAGKRILFPPLWMEELNWERRCMSIPHGSEMVHGAPEYDYYSAITREYESRLYNYYGKEEEAPAHAFALTR